MKPWMSLLALVLIVGVAVGAARVTNPKPAKRAASSVAPAAPVAPEGRIARIEKSDADWKQQLSSESYRVLRHEGTEIAFTGAYWNEHHAGIYTCAGCGLELFRSSDKFDSGTGWPSYTQPFAKNRVNVGADNSLGISREEVECARCGGHLGHVFDDGPAPTGLRYCINSASLEFVPAK